MYTSTQGSQAVMATNYGINTVRTGYETVIAHRTTELYSKVAAKDGTVTEVTKTHIKVTYKDKTTDTYPLGLVIGDAAGEYHRHTRVTNLTVGDKFRAGDILGYDESWFMPDPFNPGQVAMKGGKVVRAALVTTPDTYEDSLGLTRELMDEYITPIIKPRRTSLNVEQNLVLKVKVGDDIAYNQILCEIEDEHLVSSEEDATLAADINRYGIKQIRAPIHGKVIKIEAVYNNDVGDMSPSLQTIIKDLDKERARLAKYDKTVSKTGRISNTNVNKPMVLPGRVLIVFYIENRDPSTSADKYVLGNQMKGTIGSVLGTPLYTLDGRKVDVLQSFKGIFSRMVLSVRDKMTAGEYATGVTKRALEIYRGKK